MNDRDPAIPASWHAIARAYNRGKAMPGGWWMIGLHVMGVVNVVAGWAA